jgi:hypothetical protein
VTTVTGVTTVNHLLLTLTFRYQTPFSPPTCSGADVNAARLFKTNMAIQSTGHPLHPLFQAMVGGRPDERLGAPPTTTTFTAPWQHHRIAAADAVIAAGAKVLREPIDDSQCPASTKDAIDQLEAASTDARQLARDPFAAQTDYLQPVSWAGLEDLELPHPDQPTHMDNVPYYTQVFITGVDPVGRFLPLPIGRHRPASAPQADTVVRNMASLQPGLMDSSASDSLVAMAAAAGDAHASGTYMRPNKRATTDRSRAVIAISSLEEHERHIRAWRTKFNVQGLEVNSMRRRLSHVRVFFWFWLGTRGISPNRFILNQWEFLPTYVRRWEEEMWTDMLCWYASGVSSAQSVENFHSDIKEFLKGFLNITVPDMQLLTRSKRLIRLYFGKQELQARLRPALPTHMFLYLVHCATRQRDDILLPREDRIAASGCLLCITGSRQSHMRIGNIAVGEKFDASVSPQPFWTLLSVSVLLTLKPGENAYAMPPRIKTAGHVAREAYPWLFEPVAWNFVHNLHAHFALLDIHRDHWGHHPLIVLNDAGQSMPPSFVYKWMLKNLALEFQEEVKLYKLGTHCLRIAAQTISKAIGVSEGVRARQGSWSSAAALMDGSGKHDMAQLYGRNLREVLVEVQRYMSTAVFQTCESAGIQFKGHDQEPPSLIQSAAAVDNAIAVRHKYLAWATGARTTAPVEIDVNEDDDVLDDMEPRFDASTTVAVQDFMEDAGFPIPESSTDKDFMDTAEAESLNESNSTQRKIQQFFQPRPTVESDDEAPEHDWKYYAQWNSSSGQDQQPVCLTPDDEYWPSTASSPWEQSVLAKMITGPRPSAEDTDHHDCLHQALRMLDRSELSPPVQPGNGQALQDRVQPARS